MPKYDAEFFKSLDSSILDVLDGETLPPECYTDPDFYEFEKESLFSKEWLCVGRESWVGEAGDYFTTQIADEPIVVARARDGNLYAMSSVCQHRAMLVAEGHGNTRGFVCPYHHWTYSLKGDLVGAPAMNKTCNFDKKEHSLPKFKVEVWLGFIFVHFDINAEPLAPRLEQVTNAIAGYDLENAEGPRPGDAPHLQWNWKVMFENNNDGYHASRLHQGPLHDFVPSEQASFPKAPKGAAGYLRFNGTTHADASFNPTQKAVLPVFAGLNEEQRNRMTFANIPPTLSLVLTADMVIYMILRPTGAGSLEMDTGVLVAPGAMEDAAFEPKMEMIMNSTHHIIAQDWHVDELVQIGLRSRFAKRGRYSWQESAQQQFNEWLVDRYKSHFFEQAPRIFESEVNSEMVD
ncbi:aromatic ring-hydroxylating oxygenase subunit alpha [Hirschia baltica]|uniref:Rieske (2Fe-2S) domain protein n=1 Tax=Hirschia baltica (strain ATCC 49814 / DSM 5838 / IFAM 1418) TaxID=582402 RepID=C6XP48_HIRBI|nr:SRPBCC family protein [Hirschia baltica]ACT60228.1 Rieske (2Fe-2S) domain protein [Hirschia baltica ATCC 49814]